MPFYVLFNDPFPGLGRRRKFPVSHHSLLYTRPHILPTKYRVGRFGTICDQTTMLSVFTSMSRIRGTNYWGKYGPFVLFGIRVNKSVAFTFLITYFLQHVHMNSISSLSNLQVTYSTHSWVIGVYTRKPDNILSKKQVNRW